MVIIGGLKKISYIENSLPNTKKIKFLGGEPTIMPDVNRLIRYYESKRNL